MTEHYQKAHDYGKKQKAKKSETDRPDSKKRKATEEKEAEKTVPKVQKTPDAEVPIQRKFDDGKSTPTCPSAYRDLVASNYANKPEYGCDLKLIVTLVSFDHLSAPSHFYVHKHVLAAHSPAWASALFTSGMKESKTNEYKIQVEGIAHFQCLLDLMYVQETEWPIALSDVWIMYKIAYMYQCNYLQHRIYSELMTWSSNINVIRPDVFKDMYMVDKDVFLDFTRNMVCNASLDSVQYIVELGRSLEDDISAKEFTEILSFWLKGRTLLEKKEVQNAHTQMKNMARLFTRRGGYNVKAFECMANGIFVYMGNSLHFGDVGKFPITDSCSTYLPYTNKKEFKGRNHDNCSPSFTRYLLTQPRSNNIVEQIQNKLFGEEDKSDSDV